MTVSNTPPTVVITTVPFGAIDEKPLSLLREAGISFVINPLGRKLQNSAEVIEVIRDAEVVIAGTEDLTHDTMAACPNLKAICRVGIGLDSVDLIEARKRNIAVSYTPDAPSPAVAELTIGLMLDLLRNTNRSDRTIRQGNWDRFVGERLSCLSVGLIGLGRIGERVAKHLAGGFPGVRILAHDIEPDPSIKNVEWVDLETLLSESDIVSVHVPLTPLTRGMINQDALATMKPGARLVNTARGFIVDENALHNALLSGHLKGAAIDVFEKEPYTGPLTELEETLLTAHQGSMTADCRARMEIEATEEAIRFLTDQPFSTPVPEEEYSNAQAARQE